MSGPRGVIAAADELVDRAVAQAGLDDFGPPTWRGAVQELLRRSGSENLSETRWLEGEIASTQAALGGVDQEP